jgi:hypothetical protein
MQFAKRLCGQPGGKQRVSGGHDRARARSAVSPRRGAAAGGRTSAGGERVVLAVPPTTPGTTRSHRWRPRRGSRGERAGARDEQVDARIDDGGAARVARDLLPTIGAIGRRRT